MSCRPSLLSTVSTALPIKSRLVIPVSLPQMAINPKQLPASIPKKTFTLSTYPRIWGSSRPEQHNLSPAEHLATVPLDDLTEEDKDVLGEPIPDIPQIPFQTGMHYNMLKCSLQRKKFEKPAGVWKKYYFRDGFSAVEMNREALFTEVVGDATGKTVTRTQIKTRKWQLWANVLFGWMWGHDGCPRMKGSDRWSSEFSYASLVMGVKRYPAMMSVKTRERSGDVKISQEPMMLFF